MLTAKAQTRLLQALVASMPDTVYVGLLSADGEVSAGDYQRVAVARGEFGVNGQNLTNTLPINFALASSGWGQVNRVAVYDDVNDGEEIFQLTIAQPVEIRRNDQLRIDPGLLQLAVGE